MNQRNTTDVLRNVLCALSFLVGYMEGKGEKVPSWIQNERSRALEHLSADRRETVGDGH